MCALRPLFVKTSGAARQDAARAWDEGEENRSWETEADPVDIPEEDGIIKITPEQVEELEEAIHAGGVRGKLNLAPTPLDPDSLTFDDFHINVERGHGVTAEQARQAIQKAKFSVIRWNGEVELYCTNDIIVYVNHRHHVIRTAYLKSEFDPEIQRMMEILTPFL